MPLLAEPSCGPLYCMLSQGCHPEDCFLHTPKQFCSRQQLGTLQFPEVPRRYQIPQVETLLKGFPPPSCKASGCLLCASMSRVLMTPHLHPGFNEFARAELREAVFMFPDLLKRTDERDGVKCGRRGWEDTGMVHHVLAEVAAQIQLSESSSIPFFCFLFPFCGNKVM